MNRCRRKQICTDQAVQGELLFRAIVYWFFCLMVVALMVLAWSFLTGPERPFPVLIRQSLVAAAPAIFGSVLLLPVVLIDVLKVSNRFVGPVQQIKLVMRQLASGKPAGRVYLRREDFWQDLATYTNLVADTLEKAREVPAADTDATDFDENEDIPCTDSAALATES